MAQEWIIDQAIKQVGTDLDKIQPAIGARALRQAAIKFLGDMELLIMQLEHTNQIAEIKDQNSIDFLLQRMKSDHALVQNFISLQYQFEAKVNLFLGRPIHFAWIDTETAEAYFQTEVKAHDIYALAAMNDEYTGRIAGSKAKRYSLTIEKFNVLPEKIRELIRDRQRRYANIFNLVIHRWKMNHDESYAKQNHGHSYWVKHYHDQLWWKGNASEKDWHHSEKAMNRGHISQAYTHLIIGNLKKDDDFYELDSEDQQVERYWIYMNTRQVFNNMPGISGGDVTLGQNGMIQFAVKSGNFDTASIKPYVEMAYIIIGTKLKNLSRDQIKTILNGGASSISNYSRKIIEQGQKKIEKVIDKYIIGNLTK